MSATIKSRIQLKNDTEANWNKAQNFIPLKGEVIIYSADDTHPFFRLKVGDGITNVTNLPFVESGYINNFGLIESFEQLPSIGDSNILYFVASENIIYRWDNSTGYYPVYGAILNTINTVNSWNNGIMTTLSVVNNNLLIENGEAPELTTQDINVFTGFGPLN